MQLPAVVASSVLKTILDSLPQGLLPEHPKLRKCQPHIIEQFDLFQFFIIGKRIVVNICVLMSLCMGLVNSFFFFPQ